MKIKIVDIEVGKYSVREKLNKEHIEEIRNSFEIDGQWDPIIIIQNEDGKYNLIAGHYRLQAAKELGWDAIEAVVKDVSELDADVLSLKTNLMRLDMSPREQGLIIQNLISKYGITQTEIAKKLGMSTSKVSKLLTIVLKLDKSVAEALDNNIINYAIASVIGSLELNLQRKFLNIIIKKEVSSPSQASKLKNIMLNDTIYTIGYQGRNILDFIDILLKNDIKLLVDIRESAKSEKKADFNKDVLNRELERKNIKYIHKPELGIPYNLQLPYKDGKLGLDCLRQWYNWHIETEFSLPEFITLIKESGRTVLMCMERYAKRIREQKYSCHRDLLADIVLSQKDSDELFGFDNRSDL